MNLLKRSLRAIFARLEQLLASVFGPSLNPLVHLGPMGWFLFWVVAVSGIYVYIFFDTGVEQAYTSVEALTHDQWGRFLSGYAPLRGGHGNYLLGIVLRADEVYR